MMVQALRRVMERMISVHQIGNYGRVGKSRNSTGLQNGRACIYIRQCSRNSKRVSKLDDLGPVVKQPAPLNLQNAPQETRAENQSDMNMTSAQFKRELGFRRNQDVESSSIPKFLVEGTTFVAVLGCIVFVTCRLMGMHCRKLPPALCTCRSINPPASSNQHTAHPVIHNRANETHKQHIKPQNHNLKPNPIATPSRLKQPRQDHRKHENPNSSACIALNLT
ncbi:hypothetical protein Droror1_Dr00013438 [Drosera rotundifolia]